MNNKPGKKACLSGKGVAVDKIRKCGHYIVWVSTCASTMLSLITCLPSHKLSNKVSDFTPPQFLE